MENQLEILDYILSAVVIINTEGKIVFVNDPFLELFQYKKDDIIGKEISVQLSPLNTISYIREFLEYIKTKVMVKVSTLKKMICQA